MRCSLTVVPKPEELLRNLTYFELDFILTFQLFIKFGWAAMQNYWLIENLHLNFGLVAVRNCFTAAINQLVASHFVEIQLVDSAARLEQSA